MSDSTICFVILAVTVVVFVWDYLPVAIVAMGVALSLWATGVLDLNQALAGFGDPAVLFIAALFVVSEALDATGVTAWAGQELVNRAGDSRPRLIVYTMLLVALLTALISVNGAVAALLPVVVVMAIRLGRSPKPSASSGPAAGCSCSICDGTRSIGSKTGSATGGSASKTPSSSGGLPPRD